jgi:DNA-binding NtrC family response regulator
VQILYIGCPAQERLEAERALAAAALKVVWADTTASALTTLERTDMPVLLDLSRGAAALRTARDLRLRRARTLMFAVVDMRRPHLTSDAVASGCADVFSRPLGPARVINALEREGAQRKGRRLVPRGSGCDDLYSLSASMRDVSARIALASTLRGGVLVRGESGAGRRIVARAIHGHQPNAGRFVVVDCAAFNAADLERELFGAAAIGDGSGPGLPARDLAQVSQASRLHDAIGGTCYLRNVIAASPRVQERLARVLSRRDAILTETGARIVLDVRLVAGVDPQIDQAVREGRVRVDLYRRLSAIRIDVPPLRSRCDDIPALANYFLRAICATRKVPPKILSRSALSLIVALPWRGNAPELRHVLEAVANASTEASISLEAVLERVRIDGGSAAPATSRTLRQAHAQFERDYIAGALEQCGGSVSEAARGLGIKRTNLYRKLRRLKLAGDAVADIRKYRSRHIA